MYIIKNALKCIGRSKGRSILIGLIVLVIAVSSCIGLSIRRAAEKAKEETLEGLTVTAAISFDRQSVMSQLRGGNGAAGNEGGGFDKGQFSKLMGEAASLSLEEYEIYAEAQSVKDFYYSQTASVNGTDEFVPVTAEEQEQTDTNEPDDPFSDKSRGSMGGMDGSGFIQTEFSIIGYSGENAMTSFADGTASITDGSVFEEGTQATECIISEELALYNDISVGDTVSISNPYCTDETYDLTVVGIYSDSSSNESAFGARGMTANDPANRIYMSSTALQAIVSESVALNSSSGTESADDSDVSENESLPISLTTSATYVFESADSYREFETEVREMGLDDSYTVFSQDISSYENSLTPLNTLSKAAGWFLLVILIIGAVILTTLNIFNVRERKYEIGVLTAMGMSKAKVAVQFLLEIFAITLAAVIIGAAAGALSSVPVTNALLKEQTQAQEQQEVQLDKNFGRTDQIGGDIAPKGAEQFSVTDNYLTEINSAADLTVIIQMLGIAILLTLVSGATAMLFIMRCEPLQILENRD